MDIARQARRLYVGNCPPETSPAEVVAFLNLTMQDAGLTKFTAPVQAVHQGNSFLFIELPVRVRARARVRVRVRELDEEEGLGSPFPRPRPSPSPSPNPTPNPNPNQDAAEANELLKCDGALFKEHHLKLRKPTNNPGERDRPPRPGQPVRDMPNLPPHLRNLPPEPAPGTG